MRPVIYLDVDGVLWDLMPGARTILTVEENARGADGVAEFMAWALEHCEVRWCTTWAMRGWMEPECMARLARYTGVPVEVWSRVRPSRGFMLHKSENIAWEEHRAGRPFAWIEDGLTPHELQVLSGNGFLDCYIHTDVFEDPQALRKAHRKLMERFGTLTREQE